MKPSKLLAPILIAACVACDSSEAIEIGVSDALGCYVITWADHPTEVDALFPDSIRLFETAYRKPPIGVDTIEFWLMEPMTPPLPDATDWKTEYLGRTWWKLVKPDSVAIGLGHDGADFVGIRAQLMPDGLVGTGWWTTDYRDDFQTAIYAPRINCPEG